MKEQSTVEETMMHKKTSDSNSGNEIKIQTHKVNLSEVPP